MPLAFVRIATLVLTLLATPVFAQVTAEPAGVVVSADTVRANIRLSTDQKVVLTAAALIDTDGRSYELAARPSGIPKEEPGGCVVAGTITPRQLVSLPFKAANASPPFSLTLELQSPDPDAPTGCRSMNITVDDLH